MERQTNDKKIPVGLDIGTTTISTVVLDCEAETVLHTRTVSNDSGNAIRKNTVLQQILREKFNLPLQIPTNTEEAACGAAIFGDNASELDKKRNRKNKFWRGDIIGRCDE